MTTEQQLEKLIETNNDKKVVYGIATIAITILLIVILVLILWKLSKTIARGIKEQKAGKIAICITISLILFWPIAVGQGIYLLLTWQREQQEQAAFRQAAANIPQPESYEEFRARKLAEQEAVKEEP